MPVKFIATIPVFLPGNNRDWEKVNGRCEISDEGKIVITISEGNAIRLVDLATIGVLFQCSFDYRMNDDEIKRINARYERSVIEE